MNSLPSKMNNKQPNLELRRDRMVELYSEGRNQSQIAQILKISQPTVIRDLQYQRQSTMQHSLLTVESIWVSYTPTRLLRKASFPVDSVR